MANGADRCLAAADARLAFANVGNCLPAATQRGLLANLAGQSCAHDPTHAFIVTCTILTHGHTHTHTHTHTRNATHTRNTHALYLVAAGVRQVADRSYVPDGVSDVSRRARNLFAYITGAQVPCRHAQSRVGSAHNPIDQCGAQERLQPINVAPQRRDERELSPRCENRAPYTCNTTFSRAARNQ